MAVNQTDGITFSGSDVKGINKIYAIYTGTGFDAERDGGSDGTGTTLNTYEFPSISSSDLGNADYLVISILLRSYVDLSVSGTQTRIDIQTKEIGGSYSDSVEINGIDTTGDQTISKTISWVHTLTSGEKSNGVQVQIVGSASTNSTSDNASLTNIQTVISSSYS